MSYGILEESGETRRVGLAEDEMYVLELRVARPEYLREGMTPFYFNIFEKVKDEDGEEDWSFLTPDGVPVKGVRDFKTKVKRHAKRRGIPGVVYNSLRAKIQFNDIGVWNDLGDPQEHFLRTETPKQKADREASDKMYAVIGNKLGPGATWRDKNKYLLELLSREQGLPTVLLPGIPNYTQFDRKLTMDEVRDDMQNRQIMAMTSPFGADPNIIDNVAKFAGRRIK